MSVNILHQPDQSRFQAEVDGQQAVLDYRLDGQCINFTYTFVPPSLRGKGLAEKLVRTGLAWAREEGFQITASCWYVRKFL